ncbi:MAG: exosome complex RNA-binding protein Csl4 [Candidatus Thermoplasmatota archaeon]|nr:exosome complex RNA-binding protein Csl4 [Candidatus Thermoplasmatota archaeon]MBU4070734.1 exosome complex RNA-binding protein Csl4 [Candidatus Thermoplasmatota archaeon]MBU4145170.1 exosome complex RNA-binding protein Csl4 [Candidatus Thermoplasmatota archaeon]
MPGDELATSEEYISGQGTYEKDGIIYAAVMGKPEFNQDDKTVRVVGVKSNSVLKAGDTVLGEVMNVSNTMANVVISGVEERPGYRIQGETGVIHISKVTESYTDDVRNEYRTGDLVRLRVIQASPSLQLSSREPGLGVLKARCSRCRIILFNRSGQLYCADCEKYEQRKLVDDFGMYSPEFRE